MASAHPDDLNPYRAPVAPITAPILGGPIGDAELIRRMYLNHEASVRSVGSILYLFAFFDAIILLFQFLRLIAAFQQSDLVGNGAVDSRSAALGEVGSTLFRLLLDIALGFGLRGLRPWARWITLAFSALGLLLIGGSGVAVLLRAGNAPLGTVVGVFSVLGLIVGYVLYLMASAKARMVFSSEYREVVRQTPDVKYKTSLLVKIVLGLILGLFLIGVVSGFLGFSR